MMLPKCPFFQKSCLKLQCAAYKETEVYIGPAHHVLINAFEEELKNEGGYIKGDCWLKIKYYCHLLDIELPEMKDVK